MESNTSKKIKILVSSCEYGDFSFVGHQDESHSIDGYEVRSIIHTDDESFLSRDSIHPRMCGKINRMMNWSFYPGYDYYVWKDSRIFFHSLAHIVDFVSCLEKDVGFFKHRFNSSLIDEFNHVNQMKDNEYIKSRYSIKTMQSQVNHYVNEGVSQADHFETGLFVFSKNLVSNDTDNLMRHWLTETMIWSENDQISLPYSIHKTQTDYQVFEGDVLNNRWTFHDYSGYK